MTTTKNEIQKIWLIGSYEAYTGYPVKMWKVKYHIGNTTARDYFEVVADDELEAFKLATEKLKGKSCTE